LEAIVQLIRRWGNFGRKVLNRVRRNSFVQEKLDRIDAEIIDLDRPETYKRAKSDISHLACLRKRTSTALMSPSVIWGPYPAAFSENHRARLEPLPGLNLVELRNARLVPPGLAVTHAGQMVFSCRQFSPATIRQQWLKGMPAGQFPSTGKHDGSRPLVCLVRPGDHIFGHWLVDLLPIAWLAEKERPGEMNFLLSTEAPLFAIQLLRYLGIAENRLLRWDRKQGALDVPCLWMISPLRFNQFSHPMLKDFALDIREKLFPEMSRIETHRRIWISRRAWHAEKGKNFRVLTNAGEIEDAAKNFGFHCVQPEILSFPDQVALFANAECVAGEDGSALHMSLFAHSNLRVGNFRSDANGSLIQGSLCGVTGQPISYVFGVAVDKQTKGRSANFSIDLADAEKLFASMTSA